MLLRRRNTDPPNLVLLFYRLVHGGQTDCVVQNTYLITLIVLDNAVSASRGVKSAKCLWVPTAQPIPVGEYLSAWGGDRSFLGGPMVLIRLWYDPGQGSTGTGAGWDQNLG